VTEPIGLPVEDDATRFGDELAQLLGDIAAELERGGEARLDGFADRCDALVALFRHLQAAAAPADPEAAETGSRG
jgi:hypothetical protein